jgi:tetrahydromethanopterin S-methyltransferase subunit C
LRSALGSPAGGRGLFLGYLAASSVVLFLIPSGLYGGWSQRYAAEYLWPATSVAVCALAMFYRSARSYRTKTAVFSVSAVSLLVGTIAWLLISSGGYIPVPDASAPIVQRLGENTALLAILGVMLLAIVIAISIASDRRPSELTTEATPTEPAR